MKKQELIEKLQSAKEQLKDYNKFIDLMREKDDPKGILTRLSQTIHTIQMLLDANDIKELAHPKNEPFVESLFVKSGALVKVRPVGDEYEGKTYVGFLIGEVAMGSSISILEDKIQLNFSGYNPAIFIPELKKVVFGYQSWWSEIKSENELKDITDNDIQNVWYVKLLNSFSKDK